MTIKRTHGAIADDNGALDRAREAKRPCLDLDPEEEEEGRDVVGAIPLAGELYDAAYLAERKAELYARGYTSFADLMADPERRWFYAFFNQWLTSRRMPNGQPTGANMDDPSTFARRSEALPVTNIHGIEKYQIGQALMMWLLRMHPKVLQVFAFLHGCEIDDLVTSLDGACILPNTARPGPKTKKGGEPAITEGGDVFGWLHLDQGSAFTGARKATCYQSFYNYDDTTFDVASQRTMPTFACVPGSHAHHDAFVADHGIGKANWHVISGAEYDWYKARGMAATPISIAENALFVWDSRTAHQSLPARSRPATGAPISIRRVAYVSMLPAATRTARDRAAAAKIFADARATTSHWAGHGGLKANGKPRIYSKEDKERLPAAAAHTIAGAADFQALPAAEFGDVMLLHDSLTTRDAVPLHIAQGLRRNGGTGAIGHVPIDRVCSALLAIVEAKQV